MSFTALIATFVSLLTAGLITQAVVTEENVPPTPTPTVSPTATAIPQTPTPTPKNTPEVAAAADSSGVEKQGSLSDDCDFELHETYKNGEEVNISHECEEKLEGGGSVSNSVNIEASTSDSGESFVDISISNE